MLGCWLLLGCWLASPSLAQPLNPAPSGAQFQLGLGLLPGIGVQMGYVDLGSLKGNIGNQNYEIPADVDISDFGSVVIYCEPFHVLFASASLTP